MGFLTEMFGIDFKKQNDREIKKRDKEVSFTPDDSEGASFIDVDGYGLPNYTNLNGDGNAFQEGSVFDNIALTNLYRQISQNHDISNAIDDICDEAVVCDDVNDVCDINLDKLKESKILSSNILKRIKEEFDVLYNIWNFNEKAYQLFRSFYIDGKLYFHLVVDTTNPTDGIKEIRYIDPRCIIKVQKIKKQTTEEMREINIDVYSNVESYYIFNPRGINNELDVNGLKITDESIAFTWSGIKNNKGQILSYLHRALKPYNQLEQVEDAAVIYKLARAPERRIFYIDTGKQSPAKAESYVKRLMNTYRNKLNYNKTTGEIKSSSNAMSILEDFWLPRMSGGRGTEIATLPGGDDSHVTELLEYFKQKFLTALKVPASRMKQDGHLSLGRASEITRDELKYIKFIQRLLVKFSAVLKESLRTQLLIKKVITKAEWENIENLIKFNFNKDSYFEEIKQIEILQERLGALSLFDNYTGKYFSKKYIYKNVLFMDEDEVDQMKAEIEEEKKSGELGETSPIDMAYGDNGSDNDGEKTDEASSTVDNQTKLTMPTQPKELKVAEPVKNKIGEE